MAQFVDLRSIFIDNRSMFFKISFKNVTILVSWNFLFIFRSNDEDDFSVYLLASVRKIILMEGILKKKEESAVNFVD